MDNHIENRYQFASNGCNLKWWIYSSLTVQYPYECMQCHFYFKKQVTIWSVKCNIPMRMLRLTLMPNVQHAIRLSKSISYIFEPLIDALAQILTRLWRFKILIYFQTWWRHYWQRQHHCWQAPSYTLGTYVHYVWWSYLWFWSYNVSVVISFIRV